MGSFCVGFACNLGPATTVAASAGLLVAAGPSLPSFPLFLALAPAPSSLALSIRHPLPPTPFTPGLRGFLARSSYTQKEVFWSGVTGGGV
eukprot:1352875-Rhodomonas_salina.1